MAIPDTSSSDSYTSNSIQPQEFIPDFPVNEVVFREEAKDRQGPRPTSTDFSKRWTDFINTLRRPFSKCLLAITWHAATNPYLYIIGIIYFSFSLAAWGVFTNFQMEVDSEALYGVKGSRIGDHEAWIDNESGFGIFNSRKFYVTIHANGENVIGDEGIRRTFSALDAVRLAPGYDQVCMNRTITDNSGEDACIVLAVTNLWDGDLDEYESQGYSEDDLVSAISVGTYPDGTEVDLPAILGRYQLKNNAVVFSAAYTITVLLQTTQEAIDFEGKALDNLIELQALWDDETDNLFRVEFMAERTLDDESTRAILKDMPLIPFVFIVMSLFTCFAFWKYHRVKSRSLVGFGAVFCVLLAIISGYGFLFTVGIPFSMLTQILPFVMFGIGLDDAFIISGAFERTDPRKDPVERIHETFEEVGLSILLTTITTSLAFGLGCISKIPAMSWLSFYAFPAVVFDFLYQITFFVAIIVIDERRQMASRMDCCFCLVDYEANKENKDSKEVTQHSQEHDEQSSHQFMAWFAGIILRPWVKIIIIVGFISLSAACAFGTTKLIEEFKTSDVVPRDSYALRFYDAMEVFDQRGSISPIVYFRNVNQSDPAIQEQMEDYINALVSMDQIEEQPPFFWLRDFKLFVNNSRSLWDLPFYQQIGIFLSNPGYQKTYGSHIMLDEEGNIESSRCVMYMANLDVLESREQVNALQSQRSVSASQSINEGEKDWSFFLHGSQFYLWEFFDVSGDELMTTTILGIVTVSLVGFAFIPHWSAIFYVLPMITMLVVDLLGFLQFCGVTINAVSYMGIMMSIGLLVDFIMHILLRYYESPCKTREDKARDALESLGSSLLLGGLSTFLGILPLALSTSKLLRTVFTAFVGMIVLGITHGLIFLPVVLSIVGTTDCICLESQEVASLDSKRKKRSSHSRQQKAKRRSKNNNGNGDTTQSTSSESTSTVTVAISVAEGAGQSPDEANEGMEVVIANNANRV